MVLLYSNHTNTVEKVDNFVEPYFCYLDNEVIYEKGFGYSNLATQVMVDHNESLFRIASVTKLSNTTAILQLAEQGLVDLEQDVNHYLTIFQTNRHQ